MSGQIFVMDSGGALKPLAEHSYDSEDVLQKILAEHPELLAGDQIDPDNPRQWILVSREVGIPSDEAEGGRWSLDHLFLDQDAVPTLVEVKRSDDTRIRREVVGQMLDYASNAAIYWKVETIQALHEERCERSGTKPLEHFRSVFGGDVDYDEFWGKMKNNLQTGRMRLLFVADEVPDELQTVVEFLNGQMERAEVLAISIKQYAGEGLKTLVPRVVGQSSAARIMKQTNRGKKWDENTFIEDLRAKGNDAEVAVAGRILEWCKNKSLRVWFGEGRTKGSFVPCFDYKGIPYQLFAVTSDGFVEFYFYWCAYKKPFETEEARRGLLARINNHLEEKVPDTMISRRPKVRLAALDDGTRLAGLLEEFEWFVEQVKANN